MSFFDKYVNSKFYQYTDIFFKIVLLNIAMIITTILGLVVIGLPLALAAGSLSLRAILKKNSLPVFATYIQILRAIYKRLFKVTIVFWVILLILLYNATFFYSGIEPFNWYYFISFTITGSLFIFSIVAFYHGLILSALYDLKITAMIKHSYLLTVAFILRSLAVIVLGFMFTYTMILIPLFSLIFGLSGLSLLTLSILLNGYKKIDTLENDLNEKVEQFIA